MTKSDRNRHLRGTVEGIVGDFDTLCEPADGWPAGATGAPGAGYAAVAVHARRGVGNQIVSPGNAAVTLVFDTEVEDADARYDNATGVYTNGGAGALHYICVGIYPLSTGVLRTVTLTIRVNGAVVARGDYYMSDTIDDDYHRLDTTVNVPAGQTVDAQITTDDAAAFAVVGGAWTFIDIYTVRASP